jgi:dTDP-4-dehydrorhamnose reductase
MTWVITGGSGQLGKAFQENLRKSKIKFYAFDRREVNITRPKDFEKLLSVNPNVIVNCAAWTDVDGAESNHDGALAINRDGVKNLADLARIRKISLVHISSDYVFSGSKRTPWKIFDERKPVNFYGESKMAGEKVLAESFSDGAYVFRTAWLYSPWNRNFAKTMVKRALLGQESQVVEDQIGQPTSAVELALQIQKAIELEMPPGTYHLTNSGSASWFDFAKELYRLTGADTSLVTPVTSSEFPTRAARPEYSVLEESTLIDWGIPKMRGWKTALIDAFPMILAHAKKEMSNG